MTKLCVCECVEEEAGGGGGEGTRDRESKTRTPHKVVGKKANCFTLLRRIPILKYLTSAFDFRIQLST